VTVFDYPTQRGAIRSDLAAASARMSSCRRARRNEKGRIDYADLQVLAMSSLVDR